MEDSTRQSVRANFYEKALAENRIIFLPSGVERIFIATLLIKKLSRGVRSPYNEGGKKTIFIVNTEAKVIQRIAFITRHTDLSCRGYTQEMRVDSWTNKIWKQQFKKYEVLIMTAALYSNILTCGILTLDRVNLIVFDECHLAIDDHPMRKITKFLEKIHENQQPHILGLSSGLFSSNIELSKIKSHIQDLEVNFNSKILTIPLRVPVSQENFIEFNNSCNSSVVGMTEMVFGHVKKIVNTLNDKLKFTRFIDDTSKNLIEYGLYGGDKALLLYLIQILEIQKSKDINDKSSCLEFIITEINLVRKLLEKEMEKKNSSNEYERIMNYSSDKVSKLLDLLKNRKESIRENENFRCIIFVDHHSKAIVLYHILKNLKNSNEQFNFLEVDYFTNYSNIISEFCVHPLYVAKQKKKALIRFRQNLSNCLIVDDRFEEEVDFPQCSFIIFYDQPENFPSYIRNKDRTANSSSELRILISKDDNESQNTYKNWEEMEDTLHEIVRNNDLKIEPLPEDIITDLSATEIETYTVIDADGIKSTLKGDSVIDVIDKYCKNLNPSKFINCSATYTLHTAKNNNGTEEYFWASLKLPKSSPLQEIINGNAMSSILSAKKSAAMKTCIALHKIGELNEKLVPFGKNEIIESINLNLRNWRNELDDEKRFSGTFGSEREHELVQVEPLLSAQPIPNCESYLHIINIKPIDSVFYDASDRSHFNCVAKKPSYAILSSKKMPVLPEFPIFMHSVHISVNIEVNYNQISLSPDEINKLKKFHFLVFNDILNIIEDYLIFDNDNLCNSFFIVPIDEDWKIDWDAIDKYKEIAQIRADSPAITTTITAEDAEVPTESSSMEICKVTQSSVPLLFNTMKDSDWQLVTPRHRESDHIYFVLEVCHDINPMTPFPTFEASSYFQYFKQKHQIEATNLQQPMLLVKPLQKNPDFTLPKAEEPLLFRIKKYETRQQHFIPEFCKIVTFTAVLWLKARLLPSILHRINQLLIAEDLRQKICLDIGLGQLNVKKWPQIEFTQAEEDRINTKLNDEVHLSYKEDNDTDSLLNDEEEINFKSRNVLPVDPIFNGVDFLNLDFKNFPQLNRKEPMPLYKNIEKAQIIDIEYSQQFNAKLSNLCKNNVDQGLTTCYYQQRSHSNFPLLRVLNVDAKNYNEPSPADLMYSLTPTICTDIFSSDQLKFLGDSFIRYIVSMHLFETHPNYRNTALSTCRDHIIGIRNLYFCGESRKIPGRLKIDSFIPTGNFIPPSFCIPQEIRKILKDQELSTPVLHELTISKDEKSSGKLSKETERKCTKRVLSWPEKRKDSFKQDTDNLIGIVRVKDKHVADAVGAIIGSYVDKMGLKSAAKLLEWFGIIPENLKVNNIFSGSSPNSKFDVNDLDEYMPWINFIQKSIGYSFENRYYLLEAFTHASFTGHSITNDYQRLEFLGDVIIKFLITAYISEHCRYSDTKDSEELRSVLTNDIALARLTVKFGFHTALLHNSLLTAEIIDKFIIFLMDRKYIISEELFWNLYEEDECNLIENVEVPKVLADIFKSTIGAIYLDSKKDLGKVWEILYGLMKNEIQSFRAFAPQQPVRRILEMGLDHEFLRTKLIDETQVMVSLRLQIANKQKFFRGIGTTRAQAKRASAKQALKYLKKINYYG